MTARPSFPIQDAAALLLDEMFYFAGPGLCYGVIAKRHRNHAFQPLRGPAEHTKPPSRVVPG